MWFQGQRGMAVGYSHLQLLGVAPDLREVQHTDSCCVGLLFLGDCSYGCDHDHGHTIVVCTAQGVQHIASGAEHIVLAVEHNLGWRQEAHIASLEPYLRRLAVLLVVQHVVWPSLIGRLVVLLRVIGSLRCWPDGWC